MIDCSLCKEIISSNKHIQDKTYSNLINSKKTILYSTKNFVVLPSLGALNETHILIVPRMHFISLSRLPENLDNEIEEIKQKLNIFNKNKSNKNLIFFEHGTGEGYDTSGTCVSHAHIHAISYINNFSSSLITDTHMIKLESYKELHSLANNSTGYIFFEDENNNYWFKNNPNIPSQFFRKKYTKISNLKLNWNWRVSSNINIIEEVINYYHDI